MSKSIKVLALLLIFILIIGNIAVVNAFSVDDVKGKDLDSSDQASIDKVGQGVIKVVSTIGSIASVVVLIALGIKYMIGSTEEKAQYKKSLLPYVVGAILVFGASTLASIIYNNVITTIDPKIKDIEANIENLNEKIDNEIERSTTEDEIIKGRLISKEGSTYNCAEGVLTLVTDNPENNITIKLTGNYGTF